MNADIIRTAPCGLGVAKTVNELARRWSLSGASLTIEETLAFYADVQAIEQQAQEPRSKILGEWVATVASWQRISPALVLQQARIAQTRTGEYEFALGSAAVAEIQEALDAAEAARRAAEEKMAGISGTEKRLRAAREGVERLKSRIAECSDIRDWLTNRRAELEEAETSEIFGDSRALHEEVVNRRAGRLLDSHVDRIGIDSALAAIPSQEARLRARLDEASNEVASLEASLATSQNLGAALPVHVDLVDE